MSLPVEVLALGSAASFALSHVVSKRGLRATSITASFIVVVTCAWIVVSIRAVAQLPFSLPTSSLILFAISGIFAPAIARSAALAGVSMLGPSIAVPIQQGLRPLIILPAAALLLGERVGPLRWLGAATIVTGGWILSRQLAERDQETGAPQAGSAAATSTAGPSRLSGHHLPVGSQTRRLRPGVIYPVVAAIAYSSSDMLVKSGLNNVSAPELGAVISTGSGLLIWYLAHALPSVRQRFRLGRDAGWLVLTGILMGIAILLLFNALARGDVSLVAPIVATQPLFVFLFSFLILRHLERLERSTLIAGVIVVVGMVLVSM